MGSRSHLAEPLVSLLLSESEALMAPKLLNCLALNSNFLGRQLQPQKLTDLGAAAVDLGWYKNGGDAELGFA